MYNFVTVFMINKVHTPTMAKTDIRSKREDCCGLGVFVGSARACGLAWGLGAGVWRAWWVFWPWRGAPGVDDSDITRSSFAGAGGLPCGLLAGLGISFLFPLCIGVFPLCWASCLGVADGNVGYSHSLAGLKSEAE